MVKYLRNFAKMASAIVVGSMSFVSISEAALVRADVGADDTYYSLASCIQGLTPNSHNEAACLSLVLPGTTNTDIFQNIAASNPFEELMDDSGVYAMALEPGYYSSFFLIRTGNIGGTHGQYTFIYENNANTGFAVIDLSELNAVAAAFENGLTVDNIGKISHVTAVGVSAVPLPAAAWMMISAMGGFLGFRKFSLRRRKSATA